MKALTFWRAVTVDQQGFLERYRTLRDTLTTDSEAAKEGHKDYGNCN
ncbi:hypothetical protein [Candidatus Methylomirabilis limnetica]|nr:hypothetical protein [Candidatus Methylomirabilis limnetica]